MGFELFDVDQARQERSTALRVAFVHQLVDQALAAAAGVHEQVLQLLEPVQMHLELRVAEPRVLAHRAACEAQGLVLRKLGRLEEEDRRALRGVLDQILER